MPWGRIRGRLYCQPYMDKMFVHLATGAGKSLSMFLVPMAHSNTSVGVIN